MNNISKNNLQNTESYNNNFQDNYHTVVFKYINLINEYLKHCNDNIFIQNPVYKKNVILKGIQNIKHIFNMLFLYTKNLNMTFYNCQKSYVYYIEFISQIGEDAHSYLQLNSKDACLFALKKTIFDINSDIKKDFILDTKNNEYLKIINIFINTYNSCLFNIIEVCEVNDILNLYCLDLSKIFQKLSKLYNNSSEFEKLYLFYNYTLFEKNIYNNYIENLECFIKKLKKKSFNKNENINLELIKLISN